MAVSLQLGRGRLPRVEGVAARVRDGAGGVVVGEPLRVDLDAAARVGEAALVVDPHRARVQAEQRLAEETHRVTHYLDQSTDAKLREVVERELIAKHMRTLADMEDNDTVTQMHLQEALGFRIQN